MHITVCIKQVPETASVRINPETNTLTREGTEGVINPFDEFALEIALELKDLHGSYLTVLSMGPPQAVSVLREALARGADNAVLLSDHAFAGSDTWATSYTLARAIQRFPEPPDLILFGKQAVDGDTAQVGPGVSQFLDLPLITNVLSLQLTDEEFTAETLMDDGLNIVRGRIPVVMTVSKGAAAPRFASLAGWMKASEASVPAWSAEDISADPSLTGLKGSPTRVKEIFTPPAREGGVRIDAREKPEDAVRAIGDVLKMFKDVRNQQGDDCEKRL
ncbi:MAG: electron transfer flavoprotein subunit beta/FixA family protein [Kiritimatiellia bacterium]